MQISDFKTPVQLMVRAVDSLDLENPKIYGNYLAQTFYYVSHSTRLLAFAAGLMSRDQEPQFRRFVRHISEESAHEVLAEKDLADLGLSPSDFFQLPETRALWEPQYYKVLHEDPMSFMGYIMALEYFACSHLPALLQRIEVAYGTKARRFIKLHAEEDPDHVEKALKVIGELSQDQQELVLINLIQTAKSYAIMSKACQEFAHVNSSRSLASSYEQTNLKFTLN